MSGLGCPEPVISSLAAFGSHMVVELPHPVAAASVGEAFGRELPQLSAAKELDTPGNADVWLRLGLSDTVPVFLEQAWAAGERDLVLAFHALGGAVGIWDEEDSVQLVFVELAGES